MKKKRNFENKIVAIILGVILLFLGLALIYTGITGRAVSNIPPGNIGPSDEEMSCMLSCFSGVCPSGDMECKMANSETCQAECNAYQPEPASEEEGCMQECILVGCEVYDFDCQEGNRASCEESCGMIKEPEARSEEEKCIRDCVNAIEPGLICGGGPEGETGNEVCQQCAAQCEYLYAGPCLSEEKLEEAKGACVTCEHCYGEPVMGDSGEGYECIVDVECKDASGEFGNVVSDGISNAVDSVVDFFQGLFGGGKETTSEQITE
jgi:hypothetical protein